MPETSTDLQTEGGTDWAARARERRQAVADGDLGALIGRVQLDETLVPGQRCGAHGGRRRHHRLREPGDPRPAGLRPGAAARSATSSTSCTRTTPTT